MKNSSRDCALKFNVLAKVIKVLFGALITLMMTGCGDSAYPELKEDAIAFNTEDYSVDDSIDDFFYSFEYNGRKYLEYGSFNGLLIKKYIDRCIGYIVQPDGNDKVRIYTLTEDANCDFLIEYVVDSNDLTEPFVWRAEDTKGLDIELPKHVVPTEWYEKIWE